MPLIYELQRGRCDVSKGDFNDPKHKNISSRAIRLALWS